MPLIDIQALDGSIISVAVEIISRVRPSFGEVEVPNATKVEFGGELQFTSEPLDELVARLTELGADLVELTAPNGLPVHLSRLAITVIRPADSNLDAPGAKAVITVAGKRQAVQETPEQVRTVIRSD